jgi:hypothetical protein
MNYELGQIFEGGYPPEAALWANIHGARIVRHGANAWKLEAIPAPTEEELKRRKSAEIRVALAAADWLSMREHDRRAADPSYEIDQTVFAYKQLLRDFDAHENWWNSEVPTYEGYMEWVRAEKNFKETEEGREQQ